MSELYITGTSICPDKYKSLLSDIEENCIVEENIEEHSRNVKVNAFKIVAGVKNRPVNDEEFYTEIKRVRKLILDHSDDKDIKVEVTLME